MYSWESKSITIILSFEIYMEVSEPKWVNPDAIQYGVNTLRLGGLHIIIQTNSNSDIITLFTPKYEEFIFKVL